MFDGGQFAEFTPIEPELCLWVEKIMENPPDGWKFYRQNTRANKDNLAEGWFEQFFASVPNEMVQTRMTGALATFEGVIYPSFVPAVHVDDDPVIIPPNVTHYRGIDWGASAEHPFTCVWGYVDGLGEWYVYDEYWCADQNKITMDHIEEIMGRWPWPDGPNHQWSFADPSRPGEINEFGQRGIPTHPASNKVYAGIDCVRSLLKVNTETGKPKLRISGQNCPHLIEELRKYRWKRGRRPTEGAFVNPAVASPIPLKRDDDTVDALRYMLYSASKQHGLAPGSMSHAEYQKRKGIQVTRRLAQVTNQTWFDK